MAGRFYTLVLLNNPYNSNNSPIVASVDGNALHTSANAVVKYIHIAPKRKTPKPFKILWLAHASFSSFVIFFHGLQLHIISIV